MGDELNSNISTKTTRFDRAEHLKTANDIIAYVETAFEYGDPAARARARIFLRDNLQPRHCPHCEEHNVKIDPDETVDKNAEHEQAIGGVLSLHWRNGNLEFTERYRRYKDGKLCEAGVRCKRVPTF